MVTPITLMVPAPTVASNVSRRPNVEFSTCSPCDDFEAIVAVSFVSWH